MAKNKYSQTIERGFLNQKTESSQIIIVSTRVIIVFDSSYCSDPAQNYNMTRIRYLKSALTTRTIINPSQNN